MLCLHRLTAVVAIALFGFFSVKTSASGETRKVKHHMKIQEVKSPGGITAWLVSEPRVPLIAIRFAFMGGSAQDPAGKPGVANFLTAMLDEGAGELKSTEFQERMEDIAMRMGFSDGLDTFYGSVQTLSAYKQEAFELLALALGQPRFDADAMERIRGQLLTNLAFDAKNPNGVAQKQWWAKAFPNHPYGSPSHGTPESIESISAQDLAEYHERIFAKSNLKIAVVGDITAGELRLLLDKIFGGLPEKARLNEVASVTITSDNRPNVVEMPFPQSVVILGRQGLLRDDPDFVPAYVMNHILGGGGFSSRLMQEVREKRGLAYSVSSRLVAYEKSSVWVAFVATKNEEVTRSIDLIRNEMRRMSTEGVTEKELADAQSYLTGSYPLRFDTSSKIAAQLLTIQLDKLGIDYVNVRNDMIAAVTKEDIKRLAQRLLKTDALVLTIVGQPQNLRQND